MKNLFEVTHASYIDGSDYDLIKFGLDKDKTTLVMDELANLYNAYKNENETLESLFKAFMLSNSSKDYLIEAIFLHQVDVLRYMDEDDSDDFNELDNDDKIDEILDYLTDDIYESLQCLGKDFLYDFVEYYNFELGAVGYSDWTYVLTINGNMSFASDLWDGYNFYDIIQYDEKENIVDSICNVYAITDDELENELKSYFSLYKNNPIYLIDNDDTKHMDFKRFSFNVKDVEVVLHD